MYKRYFCAFADEWIFTNAYQNFWMKTLITLVFKLKPWPWINLNLKIFRYGKYTSSKLTKVL